MDRWQRWSPASGILFVVLFLVASAVVGTTGDTPEEVRDYYAANEGSAVSGFFLLVASSLALLWFVATVRSRMARVEAEPRSVTALGYGAGVAASALIVAGSAVFVAPVDLARDGGRLDPGAADALDSAAFLLVAAGVMVASLFVLATSLVALRTRALPRWLAFVGLVVAPITFFAPLFFPVLLFLAWVAVLSGVLLVRPAGGRAPARP